MNEDQNEMNEYQNEYDFEYTGEEEYIGEKQQTRLERLMDGLTFLEECARPDSRFMKLMAILNEGASDPTSVGRAWLLNMTPKILGGE